MKVDSLPMKSLSIVLERSQQAEKRVCARRNGPNVINFELPLLNNFRKEILIAIRFSRMGS